jgi:uncharacterized membrane protein YhaH (DUF805 family)
MFTLFVWIVMIAMVVLLISLAGASPLSLGNNFNPADYGAALAGAGVGMIILVFVFYLWALLTGVASFAVTVRRLHDLNFSGWFLVLFYVILIGAAMISPYLYLLAVVGWIVVMALPGTSGPNKYDTLDPRQAEVFA